MIALALLMLACLFWRLSFTADDVVVAAFRWGAALVLLLMALVAGLAALVA
jgi:hypothetical protein